MSFYDFDGDAITDACGICFLATGLADAVVRLTSQSRY
jgi:hypothetical protein